LIYILLRQKSNLKIFILKIKDMNQNYSDDTLVNLREEYDKTKIQEVIDELEQELVGLKPVKTRIREIAALLLIDRLRNSLGLVSGSPGLHMSFTGSPGTGKTTVAMKMADILYRLGYIRKGHLLTVTRDDLVGQYIGHTAPKTKEILKQAMGGVLFIDEAYYLYKPDNDRDYGAEAIEILLQVMENQRDDLVVIFAGYKDKMDKFYESNPGLSSRVTNHVDFPDYSKEELLEIAKLMLEEQQYQFAENADEVLLEYIQRRMKQPHFANARSMGNAIGRSRMRQAKRIFESGDKILTKTDLVTIQSEDILKSRVFVQD